MFGDVHLIKQKKKTIFVSADHNFLYNGLYKGNIVLTYIFL